MFQRISWQIYLLAFAVAAGLYYAAILFFFFRKSFRGKMRKTRRAPNGANEDVKDNSDSHHDNDYDTFQSLRDEMTAFLETAEPETFKSEILFSLVSIIKKHRRLQDERFREALNKEIRRLYLQKYNDGMEEEELWALWQA